MATIALTRGRFTKAHSLVTVNTLHANTFTLDRDSTGVVVKVEISTNTDTCTIRVYAVLATGESAVLHTAVTNTASSAGVTETNFFHGTAVISDVQAAKSIRLEISGITTGTFSTWLAAK